jgi:bifunctional non-homologous end joining protein LigD
MPPKRARQNRFTQRMALPQFIQPQLATLVNSVPPGNEWLHEIKFDGYRILCRVENGEARFLTREAQDWTHRFSGLVKLAEALPPHQLFLDGEIVVLDRNGVNDFQLLQNSLKQNSSANLVYYIFDLLHLNGRDLTSKPLLARKEELKKILPLHGRSTTGPALCCSEHWIGRGEELFHNACTMGLEGIVSKRKNEPYRSGRGKDWLKIKCVKSQEFVIGGFTDPAGSRANLGALLLGIYDNGNFRYAGRVGTGFNNKTLRDLRGRLDRIASSSPFFVNPPRGADARGVHWVKPDLVCEIAFTGWTIDGMLRHPSFKGLREDKPAGQVKREIAAATPNSRDNHVSKRTLKGKSHNRW